jgi:hypothetical protein
MLAGTLLAAAGCTPQSVQGKWAGTAYDANGKTVPFAVQFKPDGAEEATTTENGKPLTIGGMWTSQGDTITTTYTDAFVAEKQMRISKRTISATFKVQGNTLTLTPTDGGPVQVLTRMAQ